MSGKEDSNLKDTKGYQPDPLTHVPVLDDEHRRVKLQPSIDETVGLIKPGLWSIGSLMLCQSLQDENEDMPPDTICNWTDNNTTYCLRKRAIPRADRVPEGDFTVERHPQYDGYTVAIWNLSPNTFCKVKSWNEGVTTEATTIRWVNKNVPSIPTQEVIFDWTDPEWNRTFMISKRVPGMTFSEAWPSLTVQQKLQVADQIASYQKLLSGCTSDYIQTIEGTGLAGAYSLREGREGLPSWKHRVEPPVSREDFRLYLERINKRAGITLDIPGKDEPFVLFHPDINPTNYLVELPDSSEKMTKVTGLIDWEGVGYLPKWQIASLSRISLSCQVNTDEGRDWQWMLSNACVRAGLPLEWEYITEHAKKGVLKRYPELSLEMLYNCINLPEEAANTKEK